MRVFLWSLLCLVCLALVVVGVAGYFFLDRNGQFDSVVEVNKELCTAVSAPAGAEDMVFDARNDVVYMAAYDRRALMKEPQDKTVQGGLYALKLTPFGKVRSLKPVRYAKQGEGISQRLHPHGIDLVKGRYGRSTLFVVNHYPQEISTPEGKQVAKHSVEIFDIGKNGRLRHRKTVVSPHIISPNDVVGLSKDTFYVANDMVKTSPLGRGVSFFTGGADGTVVYYDGKETRLVAKGLTFANGITTNLAGEKLYVAETGARRIAVYDIKESGDLQRLGVFPSRTGVDNISLDDQGRLWVAGHPRIMDFIAHAGDSTKIAPSEVVRISLQADSGDNGESGGNGESGENILSGKEDILYSSLGDDLSASSVALPLKKGYMVVGSVFEDKILVCKTR